MAKQKVRATRHNGRKGENGVFKAGHNDRSFDVDAAEHIDSSRSFMNVYWDMYQGYNIADANGLRCQTAHCGRGKPHFIFGGLASPMVPYRNLPQASVGMTADCRSLV